MSNLLEFKNRAGQLFTADINTPETPIGTAIIHHGYPGSRSSPTIQTMAKAFNSLGFATVLPNTTHNYSDSDGDYREHTLQGHCDDLEDCVKSVMSDSSYTGPLVVAGHSAGGYSALNVSSKLTGAYTPSLTIASAPLTSGSRFFLRITTTFAQANDMPVDQLLDHWTRKGYIHSFSDSGPDKLELHMSVLQDWLGHDLKEFRISPENPTILIGGDTDPFMPPEDIQEYADAVGLKNVHIISDGDHSYQGQEEVFESTIKREVRRALGL